MNFIFEPYHVCIEDNLICVTDILKKSVSWFELISDEKCNIEYDVAKNNIKLFKIVLNNEINKTKILPKNTTRLEICIRICGYYGIKSTIYIDKLFKIICKNKIDFDKYFECEIMNQFDELINPLNKDDMKIFTTMYSEILHLYTPSFKTVKELKDKARELNISGFSKITIKTMDVWTSNIKRIIYERDSIHNNLNFIKKYINDTIDKNFTDIITHIKDKEKIKYLMTKLGLEKKLYYLNYINPYTGKSLRNINSRYNLKEMDICLRNELENYLKALLTDNVRDDIFIIGIEHLVREILIFDTELDGDIYNICFKTQNPNILDIINEKIPFRSSQYTIANNTSMKILLKLYEIDDFKEYNRWNLWKYYHYLTTICIVCSKNPEKNYCCKECVYTHEKNYHTYLNMKLGNPSKQFYEHSILMVITESPSYLLWLVKLSSKNNFQKIRPIVAYCLSKYIYEEYHDQV